MICIQKYNSTVVAKEFGYPMIQVQHHYAHILSCMTENDCQEPVIGVAFDGTGYGTGRYDLGVERFCWQIMRILQDLEVLPLFCRLAVMLLRKRVGVLRYL